MKYFQKFQFDFKLELDLAIKKGEYYMGSEIELDPGGDGAVLWIVLLQFLINIAFCNSSCIL